MDMLQCSGWLVVVYLWMRCNLRWYWYCYILMFCIRVTKLRLIAAGITLTHESRS
jgi:hypothetical protein